MFSNMIIVSPKDSFLDKIMEQMTLSLQTKHSLLSTLKPK